MSAKRVFGGRRCESHVRTDSSAPVDQLVNKIPGRPPPSWRLDRREGTVERCRHSINTGLTRAPCACTADEILPAEARPAGPVYKFKILYGPTALLTPRRKHCAGVTEKPRDAAWLFVNLYTCSLHVYKFMKSHAASHVAYVRVDCRPCVCMSKLNIVTM